MTDKITPSAKLILSGERFVSLPKIADMLNEAAAAHLSRAWAVLASKPTNSATESKEAAPDIRLDGGRQPVLFRPKRQTRRHR